MSCKSADIGHNRGARSSAASPVEVFDHHRLAAAQNLPADLNPERLNFVSGLSKPALATQTHRITLPTDAAAVRMQALSMRRLDPDRLTPVITYRRAPSRPTASHPVSLNRSAADHVVPLFVDRVLQIRGHRRGDGSGKSMLLTVLTITRQEDRGMAMPLQSGISQ
jgi:hypothetical protein